MGQREGREEFRMRKEREGKRRRGEGMCSGRKVGDSGEWVQDEKKMAMVSNFLPFHSLQLSLARKIKLHYIFIFYLKMNNYF